MIRLGGITTSVIAVGLMALGAYYHKIYFSGPLRTLEDDHRAQLMSWTLILVGGMLAIVGAIVVHLKASFDQTRSFNMTELAEHSKCHTVRFAKLALVLSATQLMIWIRTIASVRQGATIDLELELSFSGLLAGLGMFVGAIEAAKQAFWMQPKRFAVTTLLLAPLPLLILLVSDWYLRHRINVSYTFGH